MSVQKVRAGNPAWTKGVSGNPAGRPPKALSMTTILNGVLSEESVTMNDTRISAKEAVARKLLAIAMAGDISALKYIYDRMDGAPNRSGNITVTGGMAVNDMTPEGMARFKENFTALFPEAASTAIDDIPCMEEEEAED